MPSLILCEEYAMKAAIYYGQKDVRLEELETPVAGDNDIVVKNLYASICGTDVAVYTHGPHTGHRITVSFRHICSSHPCRIGNAADYQRLIGIMGLSPLRRSLRAALSEKRRKYHYTRHLHRRKQPHHTAVIALRRSLTPFREVLASEAVLLRRSGKIRSTELFSFQGTSEAV